MERRDDMRAADADREAVAEQLRSALGEGRLELHEFDERVQRAYAAKTYGDLNGLLDDLPATIPPSQAQVAPVDQPAAPQPVSAPGPGGRYPDATRRWLMEMWGSYFATVAVVSTIWLISSAGAGFGYFWPIWVAGPWGVILLGRTISGLSQGEPQRWAAKRAAKREDRAERRSGHDRAERHGGHDRFERHGRTDRGARRAYRRGAQR